MNSSTLVQNGLLQIGLVPSASITTGDLSDEEDDFEDAPFELFDVSKYLSDKRGEYIFCISSF